MPQLNHLLNLIRRLLTLLLVLAVLWQAAQAVFRPDPRDGMRRAEQLLLAGRYHAALAAYQALAHEQPNDPLAYARLGIVHTVRAEHRQAVNTLAYAIGLGIAGDEYELVRLYQGYGASKTGIDREAVQFWGLVEPESALFAQRRILEAEHLLHRNQYADAEAAYRAALLADPPQSWRMVAYTRLALLRASSDPARALAELEAAGTAAFAHRQKPIEQLAEPLLPSLEITQAQLLTILHAPPDLRAQSLGQLYLDTGLYALAEAQFTSIAPESPGALAAAAYAAYTRWRAGDSANGLERLRALVEQYPEEPRARALLALAALSTANQEDAQIQLEAIRAMAPNDPSTHLAWGQWYVAQRDYLAASTEYRRAFESALPEDRGIYALHLARFHSDISYQVCDVGQPAARIATELRSTDPVAWLTLSRISLACNDPEGARTAAEQALQHNPNNPEGLYNLGRALATLGDRGAAREALVEAADVAPASPWRERAESQLALLGL